MADALNYYLSTLATSDGSADTFRLVVLAVGWCETPTRAHS